MDLNAIHKRSGDENVLKEVLVNGSYRKRNIDFDVEPGERWLDLGANIGAFALYAREREADEVICYEPEIECFDLLEQNVPEFETIRAAVTVASRDSRIPFFVRPDSFSRGTVCNVPRFLVRGTVPNIWAGSLIDEEFDGIKMDIEGSEGPILDDWLLPKCKKLVLEYHTSRDHSAANLGRRLEILKSKFKIVSYPPEYNRAVAMGGRIMTHPPNIIRFDRLIFCRNPL